MRVRVPLGRGSRTGVIIGAVEGSPPATVKSITECLGPDPFVNEQVLELCRRVGRYYMAPLETVIATVVPAHVPRGPRARPEVIPSPAPVPEHPHRRPSFAPTPEQAHAIRALTVAIAAQRFRVFLLFGVTGSGKTDVYLAAAGAALASGRSVLLLTPEIGLAHEAAARARAALGEERVVLLHSALAAGERWHEWTRAGRETAMVAVGPRSAAFAPLARLGLVVVDEEHDAAYKQDEGIRYHGRDVALMRAQLAGCPAVLASATPSIESFHLAATHRYTLLELSERPGGRALPAVSLLDVRRTDRGTQRGLCSQGLQDAVQDAVARRGQALLFLNRRGFAHFVHCLACGEPVTCVSCSVTLTLHRERRALVCHHCGLVRPLKLPCSRCGSPAAEGRAPGTEQIEAALRAAFPLLRVARMDRDTTARRGTQTRLLEAWHAGEIDVLVGTQMVTKGIDNPRVALVGVLNADIALNQPDFRAAERTFQLVSQVAGRAGRGDLPGTVVVQTLRPHHYSLRAAVAHDYSVLFAAEIDYRRALGYPPFRRLINVRVEALDAPTAERTARDIAARLRGRPESADGTVEIVGPAPAPIERLRRWHRWQLLLRGTRRPAMRALVTHALAGVTAARRGRVRVIVDVDPYSML
jgi:primosomal protein N' (replication factor Y)